MAIPQELRQKIFDYLTMKIEVVEERVLEEGKGFSQRLGLDSVVDNISIKIDDILKDMNKCSDVFSEDERKHLEESLHADLDGYWEEIKDVFKDSEKSSAQEQVDNILQKDFMEWKNLSNNIFKKCDLNEWSVPKNV